MIQLRSHHGCHCSFVRCANLALVAELPPSALPTGIDRYRCRVQLPLATYLTTAYLHGMAAYWAAHRATKELSGITFVQVRPYAVVVSRRCGLHASRSHARHNPRRVLNTYIALCSRFPVATADASRQQLLCAGDLPAGARDANGLRPPAVAAPICA
jgi:hypothetical protein